MRDKAAEDRPIRLGVVGLGRGEGLARGAAQGGMELVALCDTREDRLRAIGEELGVATYTDFDAFLGHGMDAVVLANYFHQHAPLAVKAMRAGLHVMSEWAAWGTPAEGVELVRTVERTGRIYCPEFPEHHAEASRAGHGGGDFFTNHHFAEAIRTGTQPYLNVCRAVVVSRCGVLAWRSALNGSTPVDVPDFRDEAVRRQYESDHWTPEPGVECADKPPPSLLGDIEPSDEAKALARQVWAELGWEE